MFDLVGPILEVIKFIGRPAKIYLNYHRKFNKYVDDFRQAQADLQAREADVQQQLLDEHHFGKKPKQEVESWFRKVEEKVGHAQRVGDKISQGKYLFRSCLGKLVDEATQAMKEVHAEGQFSNGLVVNDPSTTKVKLPTEELVGTTKAEEIYQYLMGDEVRKIGVCGMGGIGKTTTMKHVYNKLVEGTKFSKVIWSVVSQDFDVRRLQKKIACQLKEELSDDEDDIRAGKLSEMLRKQGRYVLILDDVWSSFSLEEVGIPQPNADNECKLVLTTRSEEVARLMGCKKVQVPCLSTDEAWLLFLSKVGQDMSPPSTTLEAIMKHVAGECGGLPLAIVTVAGSMRGISNLDLWENALNELTGCNNSIEVVQEKVYRCLKFSYDHLRQIERDCFLCCALYPEDYEIKKEEIIEHWMEGLIAEMGTRKAMEGCGLSILQKLAENCLLEWVWEGAHIKMHDVVRDMALHITRKRFLVKAGKHLEELPNEEEWTEDLEKVSLMDNSISTIPPNMKYPKCQKLTTLLLSANSLREIPESFFAGIPNLKILDLSDNPLVNLPNSISNLENLNALMLHRCYRLKNLPSLSKLQALKKLDLEGTSIKEIPQGLEMLVNLRYLNLRFTHYSRHLEEIPNGLLPKLCRLQYLAIDPRSTVAKEMGELNKLEVFEGCFRNLGDWNTYARQRKRLHKYNISVGDDISVGYRVCPASDYSKLVAFGGCDINSGEGIILPYDIQQLEVAECKGMRSLNDIGGFEDATELKECRIQECEELESICSSGCQRQTLESLKLRLLDNLKAIVGESSAGAFSTLKEIDIGFCKKIKNLFSAKWVLHNLEEITVANCEEMEEIIVSEEEGMGTIKYTLPKLRILRLENLPELKSICSKNGVMVCDSLQSIVIWDCPKLKRIPLYLPLLDNLDEEKPSPPPPLKEISVHPKEWWESLEWDHPHAKTVLLPFLEFLDRDSYK